MKSNSILMLVLVGLLSSCLSQKQEPREEKECILPSRLPITLKSGVVIERGLGKEYYYQGDIVLNEDQIDQLADTGSLYDSERMADTVDRGVPLSPITGLSALPRGNAVVRALGRSPRQRMFWAMIRYTLSDNLSWAQKGLIKDAIATIESETNARFYDATGKPTKDPTYGIEYPYVEFKAHVSLNNSAVGRIGGRQEINLVDFTPRAILHEICHTLGMLHEQCRADRDMYITVNYDNIIEGKEHNFDKEQKNYQIMGDFDFSSIVLYDSYAFAKERNKPTMTKKDGSVFGESAVLSERDRSFINRFYLPYKERTDICLELDNVVYDANNKRLSAEAVERLQSQLNRGRCDHMVNWTLLW